MKKGWIAFLLGNILMLSSCLCGNYSCSEVHIWDAGSVITEKHLTQFLDALENEDRETMKSLFSDQALSEAEDINEGFDYLIDLFNGETVINLEKDSSGEDVKFNDGLVIREVKSYFYFQTDKERYFCFVLEYTKDTNHPENVGIYALRIVKEEDKEEHIGYWTDMKIPGIYIPEGK
jgi:hypothetical protein